jgi:NAD-dependent dihydropyrimidine dehydrogenase PreA subunit
MNSRKQNFLWGVKMAGDKKVYAIPNANSPLRPVIFDAEICNGCNSCLEACQVDVFIPNPEKGKPPIIMFPDECFYGGCCVGACPRPGAIFFNHPLMQRVRYKDKETGEHFRI